MTIFFKDQHLALYAGHVLEELRGLQSGSVHCAITSPPYWGLRDYGLTASDWPAVEFIPQAGLPPVQVEAWRGCLGLEPDPWSFVGHLVLVFRELRRVLRDDGSLWVNLGDSYAGSTVGGGSGEHSALGGTHHRQRQENSVSERITNLPPKNLVGIPWRVALALQADGWYLRSDIIWAKPNPMPESVTDRPTKAHEYIFLMSKSARYYYDNEAVREAFADDRMGNPGAYKWSYAHDPQTGRGVRGSGGPSTKLQSQGWNANGEKSGRNRRTVWTVSTKPYSGAHFAVFPPDLIEPCVLAGCPAQACAECGAPWERVVEREAINHKYRYDRQIATGGAISGGTGKNFPDVKTTTTGFCPTCDCDAPTVPGVVLDPFSGSGTTGLVANRLGRHYVGIDLSPDYLDMSVTRIEADEQASLNTGRPVAVSDEAKQMTLF